MTEYLVCGNCGRNMRPFKAKREDHPDTVARATTDCCATCYARRGGPAPEPFVDEVMVPAHTMLRAETFKVFWAVAERQGTTVGSLLSRMADASLRLPPERSKRTVPEIEAVIRELNGRGWSDNRIAQRIGIAQSTVSRHRRRMGIESPTPRVGGRQAAS